MNANKYTQKSMEAIQEAQNVALDHNHQQIEQLLIKGGVLVLELADRTAPPACVTAAAGEGVDPAASQAHGQDARKPGRGGGGKAPPASRCDRLRPGSQQILHRPLGGSAL